MSLWRKNEVKNETENNEQTVDNKDYVEKKIENYNAMLDDSVKKHGEMLDRRRDLSPDEKMELQAEITENAKKAKQEFREEMEQKYPELKEDANEQKSIQEQQDEIGDEL